MKEPYRTYVFFVIPTFFLIGILFAASVVSAFTGTFTNVSASRSFATTYQNTSSEDLLVSVTGDNPGTTSNFYLEALIGASSANTFVTGSGKRSGGDWRYSQVTFVVPAGYYYRVNYTTDGGEPGDIWWEYATPEMSAGGGGGGASDETLLSIQTQTNLFYGFMLFFVFMMFPIWLFRRK